MISVFFAFKGSFLSSVNFFVLVSSVMLLSSSSKKIAFITGATDGIGLFTATKLALTHKVLLHGRDDERLEIAAQRIKKDVPDADLELLNYDFSSLAATKACATYVLENCLRLDLLIQNAGVFVPRPVKISTVDGLELTFQVNVVAPYILNCMLTPLLKRTGSTRVINVSSISQGGTIKDLRHFPITSSASGQDGDFCNHRAYSYSKMCMAAISYEMSKRMSPAEALVVSCDPGTVNTKMLLSGWGPCGIEIEEATDEYNLATLPMDSASHG